MKLRVALLIFLVFQGLLVEGKAMNAFPGSRAEVVLKSPLPVHLDLSVHYLRGTSHEYVYDTDTGKKISQLDWDFKDILMAGGVISARPASWMWLNLGFWAAVNKGSGNLQDWDWYPEVSPEWSDWSISPVELEKGYSLDVNTAFPISISQNLSLSPVLGFKFDTWKWVDHGGHYVYSKSGGWRNSMGRFPEKEGIRYEQKFYAPYLGLNMTLKHKAFFALAYVKGSLWAWSRGEDNHLLRGMTFKDEIQNQRFLGSGIQLGWQVNQRLDLILGGDFQKFFDAKGDSHGYDANDNSSWTDINGAGTGHKSHNIHVTLGIKF